MLFIVLKKLIFFLKVLYFLKLCCIIRKQRSYKKILKLTFLLCHYVVRNECDLLLLYKEVYFIIFFCKFVHEFIGGFIMTVTKNIDGDKLVVNIEGRLDTITAPQLENELSDISADIKHLVFDLANLEYMSSAGLRVMLSTHKKMVAEGGDLVIKNANEDIMEIFDITGFMDILNIE